MKKILICGITGNIGQQAIDCIENYHLVGFTYNNNLELAKKLKNKFNNAEIYSPKIDDINSCDSYQELIMKTKPDIILNAIVGFEGIKITQIAIENNINIALANKESMVVAGSIINKYIKDKTCKIIPVDSEHTSLYEIINASIKPIKNIYITASGGPFYNCENNYSDSILFEDAIKHPKWTMGNKISIDSATLINKCFELIEAHYFYPNYEIFAIYHPESYVHSLVEFCDNSFWLNMSQPDMKLSIDLALNDFKPKSSKIEDLSLNNLSLTFEKISIDKWVPLKWARDLIVNKKPIIGLIICVLDDLLIDYFRLGIIKYSKIIDIIQIFINKYNNENIENWNDIYFWKNKLTLECKILIEENYGKN